MEPCLGSLGMQTLRQHEYEIVIVDDCSSSSETIEGIEKFARNRANVHLVRHSENLGLNEARRSGVKAASGDFVVFVDGDDPVTRDGLELLRMEAESVDADLVTAPMFHWDHLQKRLDENRVTYKPLPADYLRRLEFVLSGEGSWSMCGRLFRRALLSDDVFDFPTHRFHEDITTFTRIVLKAKTVSHCSKPIYFYTRNPNSITAEFGNRHVDGILGAARDWITDLKSYGLLEALATAASAGAEKLTNTCITRCFAAKDLNDRDKLQVLRKIREDYFDLNLGRSDWTLPAVQLILEAGDDMFEEGSPLLTELARILPDVARRSDEPLLYGIGPSTMARRLKDKIVIIGQVDYQVRSAAAFARELRLQGHPCVVLDNSGFAADGKRKFPANEEHIFFRTQHIRVESGPYSIDWLSSAKLVIVFNDFNEDFRDALEFRNRLNLPSVCAVEGINDFLRLDFEGYRLLPYRRCDSVFLAGEHDEKYFIDRDTSVAGLAVIEELAGKEAAFPTNPFAVLNVNFTYGSLENERDGFVQQARQAFETLGLDWRITQHPMDQGQLDRLPVSEKTQYELIDEGSVFVSRFATGILEALASGKPAIYFNPHHEKVDKFKEPLGAFDVATNGEELVRALQKALKDIEDGVDFRQRAKAFLKLHTGWDPEGTNAGKKFAAAAMSVLDSKQAELEAASDLFYQSARQNGLFDINNHKHRLVLGSFDRRDKAQFNEEELIGRYFGQRGGLMIDVGANFGNSLDIYLGKGWRVHAFEPDPNNRQKLLETWPDCDRLTVNKNAVSDEPGQKVAFYASEESTGISGLSAFTAGHKKIGEVETTTLRDYYRSNDLEHVDFLKIDVEGFDKFVLDGFPWDRDKPEVVLAEFEDAKTVPLGYTMHDLADVLIQQGYSVYVSEWMPIIRYGIAHDWRQMLRYSPDLDLSDTWGNLIGFHKDPGDELVARLTKQTVKFDAKPEVLGSTASERTNGLGLDATSEILTELDRLWVLSLIQDGRARKTMFSRNKIPEVDPNMPLADLVMITREHGVSVPIPKSFDEERYLAAYPDVAAAVDSGEFATGYEHYVIHGHAEDGRERTTVTRETK